MSVSWSLSTQPAQVSMCTSPRLQHDAFYSVHLCAYESPSCHFFQTWFHVSFRVVIEMVRGETVNGCDVEHGDSWASLPTQSSSSLFDYFSFLSCISGFSTFFSFYFSYSFLGATKHLYNWLCPLVGWLVGRSGNAFVRRSTRRTLLAYLALFNLKKRIRTHIVYTYIDT